MATLCDTETSGIVRCEATTVNLSGVIGRPSSWHRAAKRDAIWGRAT